MALSLDRILRPVALAAACALALGGGLLAESSAKAQETGVLAPDFTLRDIDNKSVSLSDFKGQVVLLNFWATWCGPCMLEQPHLQQMYVDLASQGFTVLSVSTDDARDASKVKPVVRAKRLTFPVVLDKDTAVVAQYNPSKTLPFTVFIDREGRIAQVHQGYNPGDEVGMRAEVVALLAGGVLPSTGTDDTEVGPVQP
ncbi:MAG: TlpA family protein disulfide reductase [Oligoflexia bacterium]|nr:TlpA family protein disulfide reductase [Oligoflexia bacterium]